MTREEVIRYLETCKKYIDKIRASEGVEVSKEVCMALDMAIKALEQEPCDDCVSRSAVLDYISRLLNQGTGKKKSFEFIQKFVEKLPSVLPKCETMQVELEGDGYADGEIVYDSGKCPKCGWKFEDGDKDWEEPFCCHCGQRLHWFDSEVKA